MNKRQPRNKTPFQQQKSCEEENVFDPEVYKRNISYFNFEVLKRCGSDSAISRYVEWFKNFQKPRCSYTSCLESVEQN